MKKCCRCRTYKHKLLYMQHDKYCDKCWSKGFEQAFKSLQMPVKLLYLHPELVEAKMYVSLINRNNNGN